ncbi:MAG: TOBE domain-containing protein [Methylobacter sp.]
MAGNSNDNTISTAWIDGELRLVGLDNRIIGLLKAIDQSGSINQAAKQVGLSYKGAWQIIERANNGSPKTLVATATGGSKGGGTSLTEAGRALLTLFAGLERQHRQFLAQLNRNLASDPDTVLLLQRQVVKTSASNQIFGSIAAINAGAVNAEVVVQLKGGEQVVAHVTQATLNDMALQVGDDAVLLINSADIMLTTDSNSRFLARNRLSGSVMRMVQDEVNAEVTVLLPGGLTLIATITRQSAQDLALVPGVAVSAVFNGNAPVLGVMPRV